MLARGLLNGSATAHGISMQKVTCSPVAAPMVTFSPHRVVTVSRARTVCWFANYATTLLPDREVQELDSSFNISQYDTEMGEKLVVVGNKEYHRLVVVDKITANKQKLKDALWAYQARVGSGVGDTQTWEAHKTLMLAMAMQEANHMDVRQRDDTKDWEPWGALSKSANCSIFNLSVDFVEMSGYYTGRPGANGLQELPIEKFNFLNSDAGLAEAVGILECAFQEWGIENTLAFVRQGRSGFNPQNKYVSWRMLCGFDGVADSDRASQQPPAYAFNICEYLSCIKRGMRYIDEHPEVWHNADRPDIPCRHI